MDPLNNIQEAAVASTNINNANKLIEILESWYFNQTISGSAKDLEPVQEKLVWLDELINPFLDFLELHRNENYKFIRINNSNFKSLVGGFYPLHAAINFDKEISIIDVLNIANKTYNQVCLRLEGVIYNQVGDEKISYPIHQIDHNNFIIFLKAYIKAEGELITNNTKNQL